MKNKTRFDCTCIDGESLVDLKLALVTARDLYEDIAKTIGTTYRSPTGHLVDVHFRERSARFDDLIKELDKIPPC
jgi:hypothetical protein